MEGGIVDILSGVMQKKESQYFRFPEVGISGLCTTTTANTLANFQHLRVIFPAALSSAISSTHYQ